MRERINFWIDPELRDGLNILKERDGVSEAEQIRRGIERIEAQWEQLRPLAGPRAEAGGGVSNAG